MDAVAIAVSNLQKSIASTVIFSFLSFSLHLYSLFFVFNSFRINGNDDNDDSNAFFNTHMYRATTSTIYFINKTTIFIFISSRDDKGEW